MDKKIADTPVPDEKKRENTPPAGTDTPADESKKEGPAPSSSSEENKRVTELEGQVDDLTKQVDKLGSITKTAQRKERVAEIERKKVEKTLEGIRSGDISPDENIPSDETGYEKEIRLEARVKIQGMLLENPDYQELMKQDLTLKEVLRNNPFALIGSFLDADDAADQIREKLDDRVSSLRKEIQPKEGAEEGQSGSEEKNKGGKEFEVGPTQPKEGEAPPKPKDDFSGKTPIDPIEESIKGKIRIV